MNEPRIVQNFYAQLDALLGKPEEDAWSHVVLENICVIQPSESQDYAYYYDFPTAGFKILALRRDPSSLFSPRFFHAIVFFLSAPDCLTGSITPFQGELAAGVVPSDSRQEVERKIGSPPIRWSNAGSC